MATAWTTLPLEIVLIGCDFFCLRVVVVTDVETGEEKRSCWCVANIIICVFLFFVVRGVDHKDHKKQQLFFFMRALSGT